VSGLEQASGRYLAYRDLLLKDHCAGIFDARQKYKAHLAIYQAKLLTQPMLFLVLIAQLLCLWFSGCAIAGFRLQLLPITAALKRQRL